MVVRGTPRGGDGSGGIAQRMPTWHPLTFPREHPFLVGCCEIRALRMRHLNSDT